MAEFTAAYDSALVRDSAAHAAALGTPLNPLWQAMLTLPTPPATDGPASSPDTTGDHDPAQQQVVLRALAAPCVAAVGVTPAQGADAAARRELQISLDAEGAVVTDRGRGGAIRWSTLTPQDLPGTVMDLVPAGSRLAAPASMTTRSDATKLRLEERQREQLAQALAQGSSAQEAFAALPDLDPRWRDALVSDGDRATFAIHFALPTAPEPVTVMRRWTSGAEGLYSADGPTEPLAGMHLVEDGDFFGTVIPLLHEGVLMAQGGDAA